MNKLSKKTSIKVFIAVLVMGIIGIACIGILKFDINRLATNYEENITTAFETKGYMDDIQKLLYMHQAMVAGHIVTNDEHKKDIYSYDETVTREDIKRTLNELSNAEFTEEEKALVNEIKKDVDNYLSHVDEAIEISRVGQESEADTYVSENLTPHITRVNETMEKLEVLVSKQISEGRRKMDNDILLARISAILSVGALIFTVFVGVLISMRLTVELEKYKSDLEQDVERQKDELVERNNKLIKIQDNTVMGMANLIESRDLETGTHIKRTSAYVGLIAREAKARGLFTDTLTDEYIELLVKAAPMHDVGKIIVPDHILQKPAKLTKEEFEIMKRHASEGGRIVREVLSGVEETDYIDIAFDVATYHHEWWNGKGYPSGKKGDDIPLSARIMAIADVFDALVSKRVYKDAFPVDASLKIIKEEGGTHFDPRLADIFLDLKDEVDKIINET
ncbi:MAG: HD domain-containing protein [Lachnospiraceae bacterium]|nr:HD domain-containing protein [Lachnospiraceae bacterium]